jgi:hypothetical protein
MSVLEHMNNHCYVAANLYILYFIRLNTMKALVYHGPNDVQLDDKPRPTIQNPDAVGCR